MHRASFLGVMLPARLLSFTSFGLGTMSLGQSLCGSSVVPFHCPFWGTHFSDHGRSQIPAAHSSFQSSYTLVNCFEELLGTHANRPLVHSVLLSCFSWLSSVTTLPTSVSFAKVQCDEEVCLGQFLPPFSSGDKLPIWLWCSVLLLIPSHQSFNSLVPVWRWLQWRSKRQQL